MASAAAAAAAVAAAGTGAGISDVADEGSEEEPEAEGGPVRVGQREFGDRVETTI
jgi:hypothetical protein